MSAYKSDHEQRALLIHGIVSHFGSVESDDFKAAIRKHAEAAVDAVLEGQDAYNAAKAGNAPTVSISVRSLNVLLTIASNHYGFANLDFHE